MPKSAISGSPSGEMSTFSWNIEYITTVLSFRRNKTYRLHIGVHDFLCMEICQTICDAASLERSQCCAKQRYQSTHQSQYVDIWTFLQKRPGRPILHPLRYQFREGAVTEDESQKRQNMSVVKTAPNPQLSCSSLKLRMSAVSGMDETLVV